LDESQKGDFMSKFLFLAAALIVLAVACNKKEEVAAPAEATTTEQAAPEAAPAEAAPVEAAPAEAAPAAEAPAAE
jgi:hypothetical protein